MENYCFMTPLLDVPAASFPSEDGALTLLELKNVAKKWQGFFLVLSMPATPGTVALQGKHVGYWSLGRISYDPQFKGWDVVISAGEDGEYRAWAKKLSQLKSIVSDLADCGDAGYLEEHSSFTHSPVKTLLSSVEGVLRGR